MTTDPEFAEREGRETSVSEHAHRREGRGRKKRGKEEKRERPSFPYGK